MLIGIISDTHGDLPTTRAALRLFETFGVERILHCGDIGSADVVRLFVDRATDFVLGNVDSRDFLAEVIDESGGTFHDRFGTVELAQRQIAFLHGDDGARLQETIDGGQFDLVCHGHTHSPRWSVYQKTFVLNPGAVSRTYSPSVAVLDLADMRVDHLSL